MNFSHWRLTSKIVFLVALMGAISVVVAAYSMRQMRSIDAQYAALIDKTGTLRAKGLVNSREHLDSLFEVEHLKSATLQEYLNSQPHAHDHSHGHSH